MKTADSIEQGEERKAQAQPKKYKRGMHPNSHTGVGQRNAYVEHLKVTQWKPGQSGNPSGRAKNDVAREIAKAVFENNKEALYKAFAKAALKGNAYAFQQLADRAYGKLKERIEYSETQPSEKGIIERITELERELGLAASIDEAGRTGVAQARACETTGTPQD